MKNILILQELFGKPKEYHEQLLSTNAELRVHWSVDGTVSSSDVAILVTKEHHLSASTLGQYPNLEMVSLAFTGYDQVDLEYARKKGIHVYYVPAYATDSVGELIIGFTLSVLRKLPQANAVIREGQWDAPVIPGIELSGKTVGILGTGTIGLRTAELFRAFKCRLIGWSRSKPDAFSRIGGTFVEWDEVFRTSDIIVVCLALNAETKGMIARNDLVLMKNGSVLINAARADIVVHEDLLSVLKENRIHAGIDVYTNEPEKGTDPLLSLPNVVAAPHIGFKTHEALTRLTKETIENIGRYLRRDATNRLVP